MNEEHDNKKICEVCLSSPLRNVYSYLKFIVIARRRYLKITPSNF